MRALLIPSGTPLRIKGRGREGGRPVLESPSREKRERKKCKGKWVREDTALTSSCRIEVGGERRRMRGV